MALYKFLKSLGNKKAGGTYPLLPSAGKILQYKGYVVPVDAVEETTEKQAKAPKEEKPPKKQKEEKKKRGRKPKK